MNPESSGENTATRRRHDVDWLRTLALGALIVYHVMVAFQPWAYLIGFPQPEATLDALALPMSWMNIWRLPLLFMISGMGVAFALRRRTIWGLVIDRFVRIVVPFVFGCLFVCPISVYISLTYYGQPAGYLPNPGHLWFLWNLCVYIFLLLPVFAIFRRWPDALPIRLLRRLLAIRGAPLLLALPLAGEAWVMNPEHFSFFAMPPHGLVAGFVCFSLGYALVLAGRCFWRAFERERHVHLWLAFVLFGVRVVVYEIEQTPNPLQAVEASCWMFACIGYATHHLNRPSATLTYLKDAVYPVYILHMPIQYALSSLVFPWELPAPVAVAALIAGTLACSMLIYHLLLRPLRWLHIPFGIATPPSWATPDATPTSGFGAPR